MELRLLGRVEVIGDDGVLRPLELAQMPRAVLLLLATSPGDPVPRTKLARFLWGDLYEETNWRTNLEQHVSVLRRELRCHMVCDPVGFERRSGAYRLDMAPEAVDFVRFRRLSGQADSAYQSEDFPTALAYAAEACSLWRDVPAGLPETPLGLSLRQELENAHKRTSALHADAQLALGRYVDAAAQLEAVIGLYNDEGLWLRLVTAYHCDGAADAAANAFRRAQKAFGGRPPTTLLQLKADIARDDETFERARIFGAVEPGDALSVQMLKPIILSRRSVEAPTEQEGSETQADRRKFVFGGLLSALGAAAQVRDHSRVPVDRVEMHHVREAREVVHQLRALDAKVGGDHLCDLGSRHLERVHALLNRGSYTTEVGRELEAAAGELTLFIGWLLCDADRQGESRHAYTEALSIAWVLEDEQLATHAFANMSAQARLQGRPREAVRLAEAGQEHAAGWGTPRLRSLLAMREALGHASLRDASACGRVLIRAKQQFEQGPREDDPEWLSFFYTPSQLLRLEGMCWTSLARYERAQEAFRESVDAEDGNHQRNHASGLVWLADAVLTQGDVTHAAEVGNATLPFFPTVTSRLTRTHLGDLRKRMAGHLSIPAVRDFFEQSQAVVPGP